MKRKYHRRKSGKKKYRLYRPKAKRGFRTLAGEIKAAAKRRGYRIKSVRSLMAKFVKGKKRRARR